jgi:hypothetical protein
MGKHILLLRPLATVRSLRERETDGPFRCVFFSGGENVCIKRPGRIPFVSCSFLSRRFFDRHDPASPTVGKTLKDGDRDVPAHMAHTQRPHSLLHGPHLNQKLAVTTTLNLILFNFNSLFIIYLILLFI